MHIKITDFGTAKILESNADGEEGWIIYMVLFIFTPFKLKLTQQLLPKLLVDDRANSFVGTAEYVSPELLKEKAACKRSVI